MGRYQVAKTIEIAECATIYVLPVDENIGAINSAIIPAEQVAELSTYLRPRDRDKRLLARAYLYERLVRQHGLSDLSLVFNEYKKPSLKAAPHLYFSFSYSHDYLLVGLSEGRALGVDIEYIDAGINIREIAHTIMCPAELQTFESLPHPDAQRRFFFTLFAAKEAIIKAFGTGLYYDVKTLDIATSSYEYSGKTFGYQNLESIVEHYAVAACIEHASMKS